MVTIGEYFSKLFNIDNLALASARVASNPARCVSEMATAKSFCSCNLFAILVLAKTPCSSSPALIPLFSTIMPNAAAFTFGSALLNDCAGLPLSLVVESTAMFSTVFLDRCVLIHCESWFALDLSWSFAISNSLFPVKPGALTFFIPSSIATSSVIRAKLLVAIINCLLASMPCICIPINLSCNLALWRIPSVVLLPDKALNCTSIPDFWNPNAIEFSICKAPFVNTSFCAFKYRSSFCILSFKSCIFFLVSSTCCAVVCSSLLAIASWGATPTSLPAPSYGPLRLCEDSGLSTLYLFCRSLAALAASAAVFSCSFNFIFKTSTSFPAAWIV